MGGESESGFFGFGNQDLDFPKIHVCTQNLKTINFPNECGHSM